MKLLFDMRSFGGCSKIHDPFDRLLVAQALVEGAALVSGDPQVAGYEVKVVW